MLFTIWSINSSFMHYFKLQKLEFKQLIDDIANDFLSFWNFVNIGNTRRMQSNGSFVKIHIQLKNIG